MSERFRGRLPDRDRLDPPAQAAGGDGGRAVLRHLRAGAGRDAGTEGAGGRARRAARGPRRRSRSPRCRAPGADRGPGTAGRRVTLSWPLATPRPVACRTCVATVAGNLFELQQFSGLRCSTCACRRPSPPPIPARASAIDGTRAPGGRRRPAADRHHRQAQRRALARRHRRRWSTRSAPAASTSSRTTNCRPTARLPVRGPRPRGDARSIDHHADRTGKKVMFAFNLTGELDEMRRRHDLVLDARRHLRHGEPQFGRARRHDRAAPARAAADPRAPQRLGLSVAPPAARLVDYRRLAEALAARRAPTTCTSTGCATSSARADDSVIASARALLTPMFARQALHRHAGLLLRPVGGAGARTPTPRSASPT